MSKNQKASGITNIISYDNSGNISFVSGSTTLMSVSSSGAVLLTNTMSGGVAVSASYAYTASSATNAFNSISASYAYTASSAINAFSASKSISSSYSDTASYANNFTVMGNLTVFGTQSVQYITSSQLNVANNVITVNVGTPSVRFGGLSVYDSGSTAGATGSLFWDSQNNNWVYQQTTGSTYTGGMLISGPRNFGGLGNEQGTTSGSLMKGMGGDHITSSAIFEDGYKATVYTNALVVSSSGLVGIGTTNPGGILDVKAGTGANVLISADATNLVAINNYSVTSGFQDLKFVGANQYFYTGTAGGGSATESVRITSTGNVGIGITTDNPISNGGTYRNLLVGNGAGYGVFQGISTATATDSTIVAFSGGTTGASANKNGGSINLQLDATSTTRAIGRWVFYTNSATAFEERMRITSTGSVGIGQTNPSYLLDLKNSTTPLRIVNTIISNQQAWIKLRQSDANNFGADIGIDTTTGGDFVIGRNDGTDTFTEAFRIKRSNGYVGIGTTSISGIFQAGVANAGIYFDVSTQYTPKIKAAGTISDIQIESVGSGGNVYLNAPGATSLIMLSTAGAERLRVSSGGLVTKPYQMFVMGGMVSDQTITTSNPTKLNFVANGSYSWYNQNVGSCWNNSTYTLTAPVTGIYIVNVSILQSAVGPNQIALYVNGSRKHSIPISTSTTYLGGGSAMAILQAGDTLDLRVFNDVTTITLYANAYHSWFNMYLLG